LPTQTEGDNALYKKHQKNPKKNIASDKSTNIKPAFIMRCTTTVCFPWNVDSTITSLHHILITRIK